MKDKYGRTIEHGDLLKVFHFTGARRKKYYMYKIAYEHEGRLRCAHLCGKLPVYDMHGFDARCLQAEDVEIVDSNDFDKLETKA